METSNFQTCPFCGAAAIESFWYATCSNKACCVHGKLFDKAAWNHRVSMPNDPLAILQLREMNGQPVWLETQEQSACSGWYLVGRYYDDTVVLYGHDNMIYEHGLRWGAYVVYSRKLEVE